MTETVIRINKRTVERTLFTIIIIALAVVLFLRWETAPAVEPTVNVTELQTENQALASELADVKAQLEDAQHELEVIEQAQAERQTATQSDTEQQETTPEPEEEDTLSGEVEVAWSVTMNSDNPDKVERVVLSLVNGLDNTEQVTYLLRWDTFFEDTVNVRDTITLRSGESWSGAILSDGEISQNPPSDVDTLVLTLTDSDDDLIDELEKVVR